MTSDRERYRQIKRAKKRAENIANYNRIRARRALLRRRQSKRARNRRRDFRGRFK